MTSEAPRFLLEVDVPAGDAGLMPWKWYYDSKEVALERANQFAAQFPNATVILADVTPKIVWERCPWKDRKRNRSTTKSNKTIKE